MSLWVVMHDGDAFVIAAESLTEALTLFHLTFLGENNRLDRISVQAAAGSRGVNYA